MHSTIQKASESKQQTKAKKIPSQGVEKDNTLSIDDQRPETAMQLKLMEGAEQSTRVHQLSAYQRLADKQTTPAQRKQNSGTAAKLGGILQRKEASNSLPEGLKAGVESLSGQSMSDVTVHRNSDKPAQLQAHAYAQGTDIHLGPGQEQHLPHEAWHVAQQKQGRVEPTTQLKAATPINDDQRLEQEADVMGAKALQVGNATTTPVQAKSLENGTTPSSAPFQLKTLSLGEGKIQGFGTAIKNLFGKTTFTKLTEEVNKFNTLPEAEQGPQGAIVKGLAQKWLDSHKDSKDPNDKLKKDAINQIMIDLKGDTIEKAVTKGIFKNEGQAASLDITEGKVEQKKKEVADQGFVDESGKIKDKKGKLMDTSFMSDAESTMQSIVEKADQNLGAINSNEKVISSDAAIHMFFTKEREKAATEEERKGVTKHAENAYNSKFLETIVTEATYSTPKGGTETKDELDASKLRPIKDKSLGSAKEISGLNSEADNDLATLVSYAQHIQQLAQEERTTKPENENEESVQTKRIDVLELLEDSATYDLKVEAQKNKSDSLIQPLKDDGRLAGTFATAKDTIETVVVSKVMQMVTMGLVSASPKFMTGGVASSEGFELSKDDATGEFTDEVVHSGSQGESRFSFDGPRAVLNGIFQKMEKVNSRAARFKEKKPITGFFIFSGALKEFENGLAYIRQIVSTIKTWAGLIGAAFPITAPITGAIGGVCEVISRIIDLISKSSKTARLIFNSLVKIMNDDPALWGLVSQNFKKSGADMAALTMAEGVETGFEAGKGAALNKDAGAGIQDRFEGQVETDPWEIAKEAAKEKSKGELGFEAGATALGIGTDIGADKASDSIIGDKIKVEKGGNARPIKIFKSTIVKAIPTGNTVIGQASDLIGEAKNPVIADPQQISSALDQETTKLNSEGASPDAISEKQEATTAKKQEASKAAEVSVGVTEIGEKIVKTGFVATQVALINARVKAAEKQKEEESRQRGGG
jgi:hypothetical protein